MQQIQYYYERLSKEARQIYHHMYEGLLAIAPSFFVPAASGKDLADIYFMIRMDHPEIFYTVKFKYIFPRGADHVEILPEYIFPKAKILEHKAALETRVTKLARQAQSLSEEEKELYIHDFICTNIRYDKLKKAYSHEIIGALGQGVAVCEGIAKAVKILCDRLNIWCIIALSEADPEHGIKYRHAWNILKIGGKLYHLDATFDNSLGDEAGVRYDYYNVSDKQIFRDHTTPVWPLPACEDGDHSYYRVKKVSFTKMEDLAKRIAQAAKKNRPLTFQWRGGYLTREILKEITEHLTEEAQKHGLHAMLSLNYPQAVMRVSFTKEAPAEAVVMQEANEGELYDAAE